MYNTLIVSNNYVTKRQSLKLLGEILLDRANYSIMTRYIASEANLKLMMNFLRDRSRNIQFEAFHVFKVSAMATRKEAPAGNSRIRFGDVLLSCWTSNTNTQGARSGVLLDISEISGPRSPARNRTKTGLTTHSGVRGEP